MNLIIIGKVVGASIGLCLVAMSGWYMVDPATIDNWMARLYSAEVYGFLTEPNSATGSSSATLTGHKLKCQIATKDKFDCTVEEVNKLTDIIKNTKKHISLQEFSTSKSSKSVKAPLASKKLYKITSFELNVDDQDWKTKPIKVFDVQDSGAENELGSIKSMFMVRGRVRNLAGKITSFIGQASTALQSTDTYKCSWTKEAKDLKACKVFSFVKDDAVTPQPTEKDDISKLTFESSTNESNAIKQHHYYLIQFTNEDDVTPTIEKFDKKTLVYVKDGSSTPSADTIVTFNNLFAVTVVEDQLLILK